MRRILTSTLMAVTLLLGGYLGGRASMAAIEKSHYDRDAAEMDRTQEVLVARVRGMNETLKTLARGVTAEKLEDPEKKFEKEIQKSLGPLIQDAQILFVQTFLLALDNAVDTGGAATEGALSGFFSKQLDVPLKDLMARQEKTQLGLGGVVLGYAIAKAANLPADEIFANKMDNQSWPEVMRARQVTLPQLQAILEKK